MLWGIHKFGSMFSKATSQASGFLWLNPSETFVKLEQATTGPVETWWVSESGSFDAVVLVGPTPAEVSAQFHALTGPAPLPPLWSLGKHQCRCNYRDEKDVDFVDKNYDKYDLPYDVIWLDIEHTDGKKYFTWDKGNFPTPEKMMDKISAKRRKLVTIVDPHIKKDDGYHVYKEIRDQGFFVKKKDWKTIDLPEDTKPADWVDQEQITDPEATAPDVWNEEEDGKW